MTLLILLFLLGCFLALFVGFGLLFAAASFGVEKREVAVEPTRALEKAAVPPEDQWLPL